MLNTINELVSRQESFAFETTLSGKGYARAIPIWQELGYHVKLFFLQLPYVEMAIERVAERVQQGGHNIPEATIRRRYDAGLKNFHQTYKSLADVWLHYDNAGICPKLIDWSEQ